MCLLGVCVCDIIRKSNEKIGERITKRERERMTLPNPENKQTKKKNQSNNSNENRELASTVTISQQSRNDFPFRSIKEEILCLFVCK
jgi:hypothetical protein